METRRSGRGCQVTASLAGIIGGDQRLRCQTVGDSDTGETQVSDDWRLWRKMGGGWSHRRREVLPSLDHGATGPGFNIRERIT